MLEYFTKPLSAFSFPISFRS